MGYIGILQSFRDAIKLFIKEQIIPSYSNIIPYFFSPVFSFIVVLIIWLLLPIELNTVNIKLGSMLFFCCASFRVYTLLGRGWRSNSAYAILGAIRGIAQTISYEVSIALLFLCLIFIINFYNIKLFNFFQDKQWFILIMRPIFLTWLSTSLAETNRTPFDFAEGESELVSGFNIEYGSGGFALLFLAEYARIIFIRYLIVLFFLGGLNDSFFIFNIRGVILCFVFIWIRGTLPRFRYDKLIYLAWKIYLPLSLTFLSFYLILINFC